MTSVHLIKAEKLQRTDDCYYLVFSDGEYEVEKILRYGGCAKAIANGDKGKVREIIYQYEKMFQAAVRDLYVERHGKPDQIEWWKGILPDQNLVHSGWEKLREVI